MSGVIVHEWLEPHGGAEKVVEQFASIYPDAPIVSLWDDAPERFTPGRVTETWLAKTSLRRHKSLALPFMPATWRQLGRSEADWILCSSHLFAHHARFSGSARHAEKFVYAYTPARYIWNPELDERGTSLPVRAASVPLRALDRRRAQEATEIASISTFVQQRVEAAWGRESRVIYPPVEVDAFANPHTDLDENDAEILASLPDTFLLGASRFIPYKRLDLVIDMGVAADVPVVLAGSGPLEHELRGRAAQVPGRVTFVDRPSLPLLAALYRKSIAFAFPAVEDFGIMPVEAMASGAAVIGSRLGGVAETVVDGKTGVLLDNYDRDSMRRAVSAAASLSRDDSVERAYAFDQSVFREQMKSWIP